MNHSSLETVCQGDESPMRMSWESFWQNNLFLEFSEEIKGCEGMGMVHEHEKRGWAGGGV